MHVDPVVQNFNGRRMYTDMVIPASVMNRCHHCDKAYSTSGIGASTVSALSGGICSGCGKPAFADYVKAELINLENTQANSNSNEISTLHSVKQSSLPIESENAGLHQLLTKLVQSRDTSVRLLEDQSRARQRSTDAVSQKASAGMSKSVSLASLGGSVDKKLSVAKSELSQLEHMYKNFNQASTLLDLQAVHKKWEEEFAEASKEMRALKTENIRRDRDLAKLTKNQKDIQVLQERLRKEINTVRNRNKTLKNSVQTNQDRFNYLCELMENLKSHSSAFLEANTSKSVLSLELSVLQTQKENLARDLDQVKSARATEALEPNPISHESATTPVHILSTSEAPTTTRQDFEDEEEIVPATPEQVSPILLESKPKSPELPPHIPTPPSDTKTEQQLLSPTIEHHRDHISQLLSDIRQPESQEMDTMDAGVHETSCEELNQLSLFVPRQLFQASAVADDAADLEHLGFRMGPSPSPPPPVRKPKIFKVQPRH